MKAKDLKNSILQMAVQGKLVPQDPSDEPASVLLERIRNERAKLIKEKKIKAPKGGESVIYRASDGSHYEKRGNGEPVCIDDEIPFEIPESWEWCRLGSLLRLISDGTHKTPEYKTSGVRFLSVQNISSGAFDLSKIKYISQQEHEKLCQRVKPQRDDILLCRIGTLGKPIIVNVDYEFSIFVSLGLLRAVDPALNQWVIDCIAAPLGNEWIQAVKVGGGTHTFKINLGDIPSFLMPIPPMDEQARIKCKVDELTLCIKEYGVLEGAREKLDSELPDRLRKSVLQMAVQGKLVPQDPSDEPASVLLKRIREQKRKLVAEGKAKASKGGESVIYRASDGGYYEKFIDAKGRESDPVCIDDEIPFDIPENWEWCRIKNFGEFSGGKTPPKHDQSLYGGDHLWVTSKDMKSFYICKTEIRLSDKGAAGLNTFPVGTMLFVVRSGILKRFLPIAILDRPATINQDLKALTLYDPLISVGLAYFIKAFEPYILLELTKSVTTVDSLRLDEFLEMLMPVPPLNEWGKIVAQLETLLGNVITNQ